MALESLTATEQALVDPFGRHINYLRLSVTDRCNYRCVYCMAEDMRFMPDISLLTLAELATLGEAFVGMGVHKIRLTGGEPLVRPNIVSLIARLSALDDLKELALTTNGALLPKLAKPLKDAGLNRINISLDSLQSERFANLTRTGHLSDVLDGIKATQDAGFQRTKLNCVVLRGRNDDEVLALIEFAHRQELDVTFIEEMPLGIINEHDRAASHVSSDEILSLIRRHHDLRPSIESSGGPARYHRIANSATRIGVISPHSNHFCGSCNRVRVTASGQLITCLGHDNGVDLSGLLRQHPSDPAPLSRLIRQAIDRKPERHHFSLDSKPQVVRFMNMTGG